MSFLASFFLATPLGGIFFFWKVNLLGFPSLSGFRRWQTTQYFIIVLPLPANCDNIDAFAVVSTTRIQHFRDFAQYQYNMVLKRHISSITHPTGINQYWFNIK